MNDQKEKIYVAVGNDIHDGFSTLEWVLNKWSTHSISIVIIHALHTTNSFKDFVHTPFGKLPASAVSEEKLDVIRRYEQEKIDKLLSSYMALCGKVKAEVLKIEKYDEPIQNVIVDLISGMRITKLVMGITFMKTSSGKSKNGISGSFYVHQHKPDYCELFILCGGKLVLLRDEEIDHDEGFMEDNTNYNEGVMVAKLREKPSFKGCLRKIMFNDNSNDYYLTHGSKSCYASTSSRNRWENHVQEIENYLQELLSSNLDEEEICEENEIVQCSLTESNDVSPNVDSNMSVAEKFEALRFKIKEANETTQLKRKEARGNIERFAKAQRAICLCNERTEEIEAQIKRETIARIDILKDWDDTRENAFVLLKDIEESKDKLNAILELQTDLSNKVYVYSTSKIQDSKSRLENATNAGHEMVHEIDKLRRQRDVLHRKIEFSRENKNDDDDDDDGDNDNDNTGMVRWPSNCREFTLEEIKLGTDNFSERLRLKCGGDWTDVYKGRLDHQMVAVKLVNGVSLEAFQAKVKFLSNIRHPNVTSMIGVCSELKCIVFEYMHNGTLKDFLFSSQAFGRKNRTLHWFDRVRIVSEVCSGLGFLHSNKPKPVIHGNLNPCQILLNRNFVSKIHSFGLNLCPNNEHDLKPDVHALGVLILHLLTGRNWAGLVDESMVMDSSALIGVLDRTAGDWPLDLAKELASIAMMCVSSNQTVDTDLRITIVACDLEKLRKMADDHQIQGRSEVVIEEGLDEEDECEVPRVFLCPIFQEPMRNPHVAADGFSYELEAIEEWLKMGHNSSPMTNLRLNHNHLTPNSTLRSLIQDWHHRRSIPPP